LGFNFKNKSDYSCQIKGGFLVSEKRVGITTVLRYFQNKVGEVIKKPVMQIIVSMIRFSATTIMLNRS
jgi:hypothetical protein